MVKGMILRGDRQSDISAYFSINQGRVYEIRSGQRFKDVPPAEYAQLPPPGPYVVVSRVVHERAQVAEATLTKIIAIMELATADIRTKVGAALCEGA